LILNIQDRRLAGALSLLNFRSAEDKASVQGRRILRKAHMQRKCTRQSSIPGGRQKAAGSLNLLLHHIRR
jgi:hypothetical protein